MRVNTRVLFCGAEWLFVQEVDDMYLLKSTNKNIDDILADPQYVKKFKNENRGFPDMGTDKKIQG